MVNDWQVMDFKNYFIMYEHFTLSPPAHVSGMCGNRPGWKNLLKNLHLNSMVGS